MEQKATVTLDGAKATLVITGELLPDSPMVHHILAALLDKKNPPKVNVAFANERNVISYSVTFSHTKNILVAGKSEHDLAVEAENRGISVADLRLEKARQAQAAADAAKPKQPPAPAAPPAGPKV